MKKLPIGIQTFRKIREEDYVYVDKTKEAYELVNNYTYVFLSRPRRFGKSLFLDTLKELFEGNKRLFEGLYIYDKWDWDKKYPVIHLDFRGDLTSLDAVKDRVKKAFQDNAKRLGIECNKRKKGTGE